MKILVFCGDRWHPPQIARQGLGALPKSEFSFGYMEDTRKWSSEFMGNSAGVILTKSNNVSHADQSGWMTDEVQAAFSEYVHNGNGLLAIHSGTAEYEKKQVLRSILGGVFVHHPEQCPVTIVPGMDHPLCVGSAPHTVRDEHYFMALDDPQADVFVTTRSANGEQPGAWRREVGKGRVVVLTPGHNVEVWLHPSFQALILNSLRWCSSNIHKKEPHAQTDCQ